MTQRRVASTKRLQRALMGNHMNAKYVSFFPLKARFSFMRLLLARCFLAIWKATPPSHCQSKCAYNAHKEVSDEHDPQ